MTQHVLPQELANTTASQSSKSSASVLDVKPVVHAEPPTSHSSASSPAEELRARLLKLTVDLGDGMRTLRTLVPEIEALYPTETELVVAAHVFYFSHEATEVEAQKVFGLVHRLRRN